MSGSSKPEVSNVADSAEIENGIETRDSAEKAKAVLAISDAKVVEVLEAYAAGAVL